MTDPSPTAAASSSASPSVTYSSTRGEQVHLDFRSVVMQGLASDKGLFVPDTIPTVTVEELQEWQSLSYVDLAICVIRKFVQDDQIPLERLTQIVQSSCAAFRTPEVTPVVQVGGHAILELFHGPTFAFKDVALQMLGNIFEYFLETGSNNGRLAVLGATSGDTGSAAIYGLRNKRGMDCIILFPHGRVSPLQERQMTTVLDSNIHCVAIEQGTFDDCQDIVKASFGTSEFRDRVHLGAVNSINWCRVLAQTTYYFWSYFRIQEQTKKSADAEGSTTPTPVSFSVPTGNFGDVLAGYYAKQMGLPVDKLIVATNENDILHRFFTTGEYHRQDIQDSISPSMDICVSSNFERYLYHLAKNSPTQLLEWMNQFESTHQLSLTEPWLQQAQQDFLSARADTTMTLQVIQDYYNQYNYLLCPHSAVGVSAIHQLNMVQPNVVCLATAHAGKFPDAVSKALQPLPLPPQLAELESLPTRCALCPKDATVVQAFMEQRIQDRIQGEEKEAAEQPKQLQQAKRGTTSAAATPTTTSMPSFCGLEQEQRWVWIAAAIGVVAIVVPAALMANKRR